MLPVAPRNLLDHDRLTAAAIDTPHRVQQKNQKSPEGNELDAALGQLVVAGGGLVGSRTTGPGAFARAHGNPDTVVIGTEPGLVVNEFRKTVSGIQNREE